MKPKVIVIAGPTASGKTALSIELAKKINGEIVSADSMQIYKDMSIGTAKPTKQEMENIKHYMIDFVSPETRYSVSQYKSDALLCIEEIINKGKMPIVVGGTGLYIDSLIYGIEFQEMPIDLEYRNKLNKIADEVPYDYKVFAIDMDREKLYEKINKRVDIMIENGLIEEVQALIDKYSNIQTAMQSLGYKEVVEYFNGLTTREEMIDKIKMESRRYAKRQLTWFRKNKDIIWLNGLETQSENIDKIIANI